MVGGGVVVVVGAPPVCQGVVVTAPGVGGEHRPAACGFSLLSRPVLSLTPGSAGAGPPMSSWSSPVRPGPPGRHVLPCPPSCRGSRCCWKMADCTVNPVNDFVGGSSPFVFIVQQLHLC